MQKLCDFFHVTRILDITRVASNGLSNQCLEFCTVHDGKLAFFGFILFDLLNLIRQKEIAVCNEFSHDRHLTQAPLKQLGCYVIYGVSQIVHI